MTRTLHYHPLASYCWKVQIALEETGIEHERVLVDLGDPTSRASFLAIAPLGKMPVLVDAGEVVVESSLVVEHLAIADPRARHLVPTDPRAALVVRRLDRLFDLHVQEPMQRIVLDRLRSAAERDPSGVAAARASLRAAYDVLERELGPGPWAAGMTFTLADCSAAPALYYGNEVQRLGAHERLRAYLQRLRERPSFVRVLAEAEPWFANFPRGD